jgi:hypothetical protein
MTTEITTAALKGQAMEAAVPAAVTVAVPAAEWVVVLVAEWAVTIGNPGYKCGRKQNNFPPAAPSLSSIASLRC